MKISATSVILGISAVGVLVLAAFYMKGRMKKKEETETPPATETAPAKPAPTQESLARAAGMRAPQQQLVRTPVGYMMN